MEFKEYWKKALEDEMDKGVDLDDPYWDLFRCKDAVNDSIVEAYKLGFKNGMIAASERKTKFSGE